MRENILHTDMGIDKCRSELAEATAPWPGYGTVALGKTFEIRHYQRVIGRHDNECFVLALEKYGRMNFLFYRGIGFRLVCYLAEEIGCSGTRIVCRLNDYLVWRVLGCIAFVCYMAFNAFKVGFHLTGFQLTFVFLLSSLVFFLALVMPSFVDDEATLISFLKKTLNASEVKPE